MATTVELTDRERAALDMRERGMTNQEIADAMGIKSAGAAGGYVTSALRKLGREHEIGGNGNRAAKGTTRKATDPVSMAEQQLALIDDERNRLKARVADAERAVKEHAKLDPAKFVADAIVPALTEQIAELQARIDAVTADPKPVYDEHADKLTAARDAAVTARDDAAERLDADADRWAKVLDAFKTA